MTDYDFQQVISLLKSLWPKIELDNGEWLRIWRSVVDARGLDPVLNAIRTHAACSKFPIKPSELRRYLAPDAPSEDPNPKHGKSRWDVQRSVWASRNPERASEFQSMTDAQVEDAVLRWVWEGQRSSCGPESLGSATAYWEWQVARFRHGTRKNKPVCDSSSSLVQVVKLYLEDLKVLPGGLSEQEADGI